MISSSVDIRGTRWRGGARRYVTIAAPESKKEPVAMKFGRLARAILIALPFAAARRSL